MGGRAAAVCLQVAARRPASWLVLGAVALAAWSCSAVAGGWWPPAAILVGAVGAAAAVGGLPRGNAAAWAAARVIWPGAGTVLAWLAGGVRPVDGAVAATAAAACAATATLVAVATSAGAPPATASGVALAAAVAAATAAAASDMAAPWAAAWPLVALAGWGLAAPLLVTRAAARSESAAPGTVPPALMVSALVAMVVCLFLAPEFAWGYAAVAGAWLLCDAVPRAALGPGPADDAARRVLTATAAGGRARPGRAATRVVAASAAALLWPPLVAAILAGTIAAGARPLAIAAAITAGASACAAMVAASLAAGGSRDTALSAALCAVLAVFAAAAVVSAHGAGPANPPPGLMLSNPGDPATLPEPWEEPRRCQSPRGVASCPASPVPACSCRAVPRRCWSS